MSDNREIGIYGRYYDAPGTKRAYSYKHQPDNAIASRLGAAMIAASAEQRGDNIDGGLILLRHLAAAGFGVFQE